MNCLTFDQINNLRFNVRLYCIKEFENETKEYLAYIDYDITLLDIMLMLIRTDFDTTLKQVTINNMIGINNENIRNIIFTKIAEITNTTLEDIIQLYNN